jgi:hypothetical protein
VWGGTRRYKNLLARANSEADLKSCDAHDVVGAANRKYARRLLVGSVNFQTGGGRCYG